MDFWNKYQVMYPKSELLKNLIKDEVEKSLLLSTDFPLLQKIFADDLVETIKERLFRIGADLTLEEHRQVLLPFEIRSEETLRVILSLLIGKATDDPLRIVLLEGLLVVDEYSLLYLEEMAMANVGEMSHLLMNLLCLRKLGLPQSDFFFDIREGVERSIAFLRRDFLQDVREEYVPYLEGRISGIERSAEDEMVRFRENFEKELIQSPTMDLYQLVMNYIDGLFRRLPVDETGEIEEIAEWDEFEDYPNILAMMYTRFGARLAGEILKKEVIDCTDCEESSNDG
jgi:hypothetical protein